MIPAAHTITMKDGRRAIIRPLEERDFDELYEIEMAVIRAGIGVVREADELAASRKDFAKKLSYWLPGGKWGDDNGCFLVSAIDGRVTGAGQIRRQKASRIRHNATVGIGIDPKFQELGLGRAIMQGLIAWARSGQGRGVTRIDLNVFASNERAVKLYESLGFVREGARRGFVRDADGTLHDDLMMVLFISDERP